MYSLKVAPRTQTPHVALSHPPLDLNRTARPRRRLPAAFFISRRLVLSHQECKLGVTEQSWIPSPRDRARQLGQDLWERVGRVRASELSGIHLCACFMMAVIYKSLKSQGINLRLASKSRQESILIPTRQPTMHHTSSWNYIDQSRPILIYWCLHTNRHWPMD